MDVPCGTFVNSWLSLCELANVKLMRLHAEDEKTHINSDLERLTGLVVAFQQSISQFLPVSSVC